MALSFDSDHETNELRDGAKSIGRMAWGQYGVRQGVPRILDLLAKHDVRATFFVPAVSALLHPDEQHRVAAEGHEVGIHGWIHELNSVLPYEIERDLMLRSSDTLERITRRRPVGLRTPSWDFSFRSLRPQMPVEAVFDIFRRELEGAWAEGGIFQLTMPPHHIGYRSRIWMVDELIRLAKGMGDVWFATHAEVAQWAKDNAQD